MTNNILIQNNYFSFKGDTGIFTINAQTGDLLLNQILDRETRESYELKVQAIDLALPHLMSRVTVKINVDDVNDNTPMFLLPSYSAEVKENLPTGTQVIQIEASDKDLTGHLRLVNNFK